MPTEVKIISRRHRVAPEKRRRIHAVRDFDQVSGRVLERYIEAMGERDLAEFREVWG